MKAIGILLLPWFFLSRAMFGLEAAELGAEPLLVQIEVTKPAQGAALVPIRIQITNKTNRDIYLPFNVEYLSEFDFRPKGPVLGYVDRPWSPSIEEEAVLIEPGKTFSATTDLARYVRLVRPGDGEIEYEAYLAFSEEKNARGPAKKFTARGTFTVHVTPEMVQTIRRDLRPGDWTLKCTTSSYRKENKTHYGIAVAVTYSGEKPIEIALLDDRSDVTIVGPQTLVARERPQKGPTVSNPLKPRAEVFELGETKNFTVWLEDYFQSVPPGTYDLTVQLKLWTDDAKRKPPLVISAPLRMTIGDQ